MRFRGFIICVGLVAVMQLTCLYPAVAVAAGGDFLDSDTVRTYEHESNVACAPTAVYEVVDDEGLAMLAEAPQKPSNAILRINAEGEVISPNGEALSTLEAVYTQVLQKDILPVVQVESEGDVSALLTFVGAHTGLTDWAVLSTQPTLVKAVREACSYARGIWKVPEGKDRYEMVKTATQNQASILLLPQTLATTETVRYLQGMFKTVWVEAEGADEIALSNAVFSGAYGVVADPAALYAFYDKLSEGGERVFVRTPYIVGHRGDPEHCQANSLSGVLSAVEKGATHVEIDVHLTRDKHLVVMHDDTIDATTNGSGYVADMTLEELRSYRLVGGGLPEEMIPTFEEVVAGMLSAERKAVLVVELKCEGTEVVEKLRDCLQKSEFAPILERTVAISFSAEQLLAMKELLPYVPTSRLNNTIGVHDVMLGTLLSMMGQCNSGLDIDHKKITKESNQQLLRDRGIICWTWTHKTREEVATWEDMGFVGLTTDEPTHPDKLMGVVAETQHEKVAVGDEILLCRTNYGGKISTVCGRVAFVSKDNRRAVAVYTDENYRTYYTQSFAIELEGAVSPSVDLGVLIGCLCGGAVLSVGAVVLLVLLHKHKPGKKK